MTQIKSIRISDFKGIDEIKIPSKQFNVITGRNNTGKTSILEAINLLFNPREVEGYNGNVRYLVKSQRNSASISANYQSGQTSFYDFQEGAKRTSQREMGIRIPRDEEVINNFIEGIYDVLELNRRYPVPAPKRIFNLRDVDINEEEFTKLIQEQLRDTVSSISSSMVLNSGIKDNMIILEIQGEEYPVIYFGESYEHIRSEVVSISAQAIVAEFEDMLTKSEMESVNERLLPAIHSMLAPRFGSLRIIGELPNDIPEILFIDNISGKRSNFDLDQDRAAVKTREIQEYIIDNNIIPGLVDFSFDKVVFDDGPNKEPYEVPYEFLGDGVKIFVRILWELFDKDIQNQVLMLEEPENHMHPGYIERLVTQLVDISYEKNVQIFMTTHDLDLLDAFYSPQMEGQREEFLDRSFQLTQLTDSIPKTMDYETFHTKRDDLNLDPRGI